MQNNINVIQNRLKEHKFDALFVSDQYNVTYLTGFYGFSAGEREAFLFITRKSATLLTFPTYYGMYENGGEEFSTVCITADIRLSDHLRKISKQENIRRIGFEQDNLTISELQSLKEKVHLYWRKTEHIVEKARLVKQIYEIAAITKAASITDQTFEFIRRQLKEDVTEKDIALSIEYFIKKNAQDVAFPPIVAFNQNAAIPHYMPSAKEKLQQVSLVLLDFGAKMDNYCSDMSRVVFMGTPSEKQAKIYTTVCTAQQKALESLKVGTAASLTDTVAKEYITSQGFSEYQHGLGHGVGLAIHENPRLRSGNSQLLKENMVVTVEPGIYIPGYCGVRIEDLIVLRKDGNEILSKSTKEMIHL